MVVLGLLLLVTGSGIALVAGVPTAEETERSAGGTIVVEQHHSARAAQDATVYPPGKVLRGKSLYLLSEAPNVTVQEAVKATGRQPVTLNVETGVVYHVRYSDSVIYREHGVSASENGKVTDGNMTVRLPVNVTRVQNKLGDLRDSFGDEAGVQALLVTRVRYNFNSSGTVEIRSPIRFTSKGYHVTTTTERERYGDSETVRKPAPDRTVTAGDVVMGHMQLFGLVLALVGLSVGGVGLGYLRRKTEADEAALRRELLHRRFSQLIATVDSGDCPAVDREMESLQDLMFVGEDGGEPVLYFPDSGRYVVVCDGTVYGYQFDSQPSVFGNDPDRQ